MPQLIAASTVLLVRDVVNSANWYRDKLGFSIEGFWGEPPGFAIIKRDDQYIMFHNANPDLIKPNWKIADKTSNVYFWVKGIDELYQNFIDSGATIDYTIYNTPWGTREFGINDPDEYDISFGEILH